ncbi:MAG: PorT family protein [Treponema sp.]|jgi:hypothetical protein|nr:PorT family protein [Treponema sp.]
MNKNRSKIRLAFFGLWFVVLSPLSAQNGAVPEGEISGGYDNNGKAIVSIIPFTGENEAAASFNQAVTEAVVSLRKYSPRQVSAETVQAAGVRTPTDMPPVRELVPGVRYALTGGVYPGNHEGEYYLQLWLWDMINSTMIYTDDLVYQNIDEGLESLPGLVEWLFSHIVETAVAKEPEKAREDKLIAVGLRSGVSGRWYTNPDESASGANALVYEGGFFVSAFLHPLLSIQGEMNFTFDSLVYRGITDTDRGKGYNPVLANENYTSFSLMFPFIVKANFKTGHFRLAPFAGVYAFVPLGEASYRMNPPEEKDSFSQSVSAPFGYTLGFEAATPCGPGMVLADIRYAGDFGAVTIHDSTDVTYRRSILSVTLGYAFGFITLKK